MCYWQIFAAAAEGAGAWAEAQANARAARHQAELDEYNAELAETEAKDAERRGAKSEARFRTQGRMFAGSQTADRGASGVDVGSGTSIDIAMDTARGVEADALTIRSNAAKEAAGHRDRRDLFLWEAEINRDLADYYEDAGILAGGGTVIRGAGEAYGQYGRDQYYDR